MSVLGLDGFTAYSFLDDMDGPLWVRETNSANAELVTDGGQHERGGFRVGGLNLFEEEWYFDLGGSKTEVTCGFWFKLEDFDTTDDLEDLFWSIRSGASTYRGSLRIFQDGSITFRKSSNSTEYFDSTDITETADGQQHFLIPGSENKFEIKLSLLNLSGSVEIRVNDELWFQNLLGVDLDGTATRIYFQTASVGSGAKYQISDFYVLEDDGTDPIGFLGSGWKVEVLSPTSESATESDFTPQSGTNNSMVDDPIPHDADSTWVESTVNGDIDRYLTTGTLDQARVLAVQVWSVARHLGSADNFRNTIFENATAANGSTEALTESFVAYASMFTVNPDTTAEWLQADVEACEFGVENMA